MKFNLIVEFYQEISLNCAGPLYEANPELFKREQQKQFGRALEETWFMMFGAKVQEAGLIDDLHTILRLYNLEPRGQLNEFIITQELMIRENEGPDNTERIEIKGKAEVIIDKEAFSNCIESLGKRRNEKDLDLVILEMKTYRDKYDIIKEDLPIEFQGRIITANSAIDNCIKICKKYLGLLSKEEIKTLDNITLKPYEPKG